MQNEIMGCGESKPEKMLSTWEDTGKLDGHKDKIYNARFECIGCDGTGKTYYCNNKNISVLCSWCNGNTYMTKRMSMVSCLVCNETRKRNE